MFLLNPLIALVWLMTAGWLAMLGLGALHHSGLEWVPAMGFGQTILSILVVDLVLNYGRMVERLDTVATLSKVKKG